MSDYLKLAAIAAIFVLGSAIDSAEANPNQWAQQQHRQNIQRQQQFTRQHQENYYNAHSSYEQQRILQQQYQWEDQQRRAREDATIRPYNGGY